jgi:DNA-binding NarL/FixJ family response regulator
MNIFPTLLILENDSLLSLLLETVLQNEGYQVIGSASQLLNLDQLTIESDPDVILVLGNSKFMSSTTYALTKLRVKFPDLRIVFCSSLMDIRFSRIPNWLKATSIYLQKNQIGNLETLTSSIADSRALVNRSDVNVKVIKAPNKFGSLSPHDIEFLSSISEGKSNSSIGNEMSLNTSAVESSIIRLAEKLEIGNSPELNQRIMIFRKYLELSGVLI